MAALVVLTVVAVVVVKDIQWKSICRSHHHHYHYYYYYYYYYYYC